MGTMKSMRTIHRCSLGHV